MAAHLPLAASPGLDELYALLAGTRADSLSRGLPPRNSSNCARLPADGVAKEGRGFAGLGLEVVRVQE